MYQFRDAAFSSNGGAAGLSVDGGRFRAPSFDAARFGRAPAGLPLPDIQLVTDLGARIGSGEWFRGLGTCLALCWAAWSFAPGLDPLVAASPAPYGEAQFDQVQALGISPLALGADTGRRMAPTDAVAPLTDIPERPSITLTAQLGRGDGFARALERAGVASAEAKQAEALIAGAIDLTEVKAGTPLQVTLGRRANRNVPRPLDALEFRARFDLKLGLSRVNGALTLVRTPIAVDDTPLRVRGTVGSSLYRAARAAGAPAKAVEAYLRAIATQVSVGSLGANDVFDIIVEHRRAETGETEVGKVLYAGLERTSGKKVQLMQWEQGGRTQWFEASGVGKESGLMQRPVPGRVSSNFGMRRHPILGYSRMHKGMDFRAGYGTPILAAADGRVTRAGRAGGYGNQVRLSHSGGLSTSYSHMSRISARSGSYVKQGQVLGYVGSTGLSTGPHLHYEMYRNGRAINPASVKFTERAQLTGADLSRFRSRLNGLLGTPVLAKAEPKPTAGKTAAVR